MPITIKVKTKDGGGSGAPTSLAYGELAVDGNGVLYVGDFNGDPVQIVGGGGGGTTFYVDEATLLADTPSDGTIGYAETEQSAYVYNATPFGSPVPAAQWEPLRDAIVDGGTI
jgi:hypothetical protein